MTDNDFQLAPLTAQDSLRDRPDDAFIERMRRQFPAEREMDEMLTRKMRRRHRPAYEGANLERMTTHLQEFLQDHLTTPFRITQQRWFSGGASKIQMGFTLEWTPPGRRETTTRMVVRMEPSESINSTSRAREFQLLRLFQGVLPVPEAYWVDAQGQWFPEPALIYAFSSGVTKPRVATTGQVAGIGTNFGPELRARLAPQFVKHLATIHTTAIDPAALDAFNVPTTGSTESALWQLNRARRIWEEDRGEELPLIEVAGNWLERNLPTLDHVSILHGDYRSGNFLFDEGSGAITAVLDWERGYLGDRHRDLAWTADQAFGHMAEDGKTFLASGLMPNEAFFDAYEKQSGLPVDPKRLHYYTIFNAYQLVMSAIATAYRVVRLGKSHQDILVASVEPVGYSAAETLRRHLEEAL